MLGSKLVHDEVLDTYKVQNTIKLDVMIMMMMRNNMENIILSTREHVDISVLSQLNYYGLAKFMDYMRSSSFFRKSWASG